MKYWELITTYVIWLGGFFCSHAIAETVVSSGLSEGRSHVFTLLQWHHPYPFHTYTSLSTFWETPSRLCCKGNLHPAAMALSDSLLGGGIHTSNGTEGSEVNNRGETKKKEEDWFELHALRTDCPTEHGIRPTCKCFCFFFVFFPFSCANGWTLLPLIKILPTHLFRMSLNSKWPFHVALCILYALHSHILCFYVKRHVWNVPYKLNLPASPRRGKCGASIIRCPLKIHLQWLN